jgi:hypothetical protein
MKEASKCYTCYDMCYYDYTHTKHHFSAQRCHVMFDFQCPHPIAHEACTHLLAHPFSKVTLPWTNVIKLELTKAWNCSFVLINKDSIHTCFSAIIFN